MVEYNPYLKEYDYQLDERNIEWKGNKASRLAIHFWVIRRKEKPELCEECNKKPPFDLANISGKYLRDINDYRWLCRSCHMHTDGRIKNLWKGDPSLNTKQGDS
jgi:hypothetical protein